mgnify:CR=1 FL=1
MNALSHQPVSRHPLGAEVQLYVIYRLVAAALVALMLVLPASSLSWGVAFNSAAGFTGMGYVLVAGLLLALSFTRVQVRWQLIVGTIVDLGFASVVLSLLPEAIAVIGVLLLFTIASGALMVSTSFGALSATLSCAMLISIFAGNEASRHEMGPYLIPLMLAYYTIALLAGRIGHRIALATWATSAQQLEIAELSALTQQILERLPAGVVVVDAKGDIQSSNEVGAQLLQLPPEGDRRSLAVASPELQRMMEAWERNPDAERSPVTVGVDARQIEPQFFQLHPDSDEVLVFLEDTSQATKRAESITLATLGRFSASLAHEIRNPLSAIKYSAQLLNESSHLDVMDRRMLDIIDQQIQRMNGIIDSVLGLARRERAQPQDFDLGEMLHDFLAEYAAGFPLDNDTLELQAPSTKLRAHADPKHVHQILMVLVSNARYYGRMPDQPAHMILRLRDEGLHLIIDVLDRGPGIQEHAQKGLFRPFFTTSSHGTGLGLYIARELARSNDGDLQYLRRANGSCFRLILPHAPTAP